MKLEFGYEWRDVLMMVVVTAVVGVIFSYQNGFSLAFVIAISILGIGSGIWRAYPLCRVLLTDYEIDINFLFPTRKGGKYHHVDIEYYGEIKLNVLGKKIVVGGVIQPTGGNQLFIMKTGIKNFDKLNSALIRLYPALLKAEQGAGGSRGDHKH